MRFSKINVGFMWVFQNLETGRFYRKNIVTVHLLFEVGKYWVYETRTNNLINTENIISNATLILKCYLDILLVSGKVSFVENINFPFCCILGLTQLTLIMLCYTNNNKTGWSQT